MCARDFRERAPLDVAVKAGVLKGIELASYILSKRMNERVHVAVKAGFHDVAQELVEAGARALHVAKASPLP